MIESDIDKGKVYGRLLMWLAVEAETALLQVELEAERRARLEEFERRFRERLLEIKKEDVK